MNPFVNQYPEAAKKFFIQLLSRQIVQTHWRVIERLCDSVRHERDYKELAKMLMATYDAGFTRSVNEHKKVLKNAGIDVKIVSPKPKSPKIFK